MACATSSRAFGKTLEVGTPGATYKKQETFPARSPTTLKFIVYLICIAAIAFAASMLSGSAAGGNLSGFELLLAVLAVSAFARWRTLVRRREKQKLDEMRDSALW